jgi:hypothetical protein
MPPRCTKTSQQEASFLRHGLDPQIECFFCTTCRFFGCSGVWVKLEMYDPASSSNVFVGDGGIFGDEIVSPPTSQWSTSLPAFLFWASGVTATHQGDVYFGLRRHGWNNSR